MPLSDRTRSADFQSAVSPNCIRQDISIDDEPRACHARRIENPRYSRLKICATVLAASWILVAITGCGSRPARQGDEIIVAGQYVHTGTRVVTWLDRGGLDAYRVESPADKEDAEYRSSVNDRALSNRYDFRDTGLPADELARVRRDGWTLPTLQKVVDQFVLHYDTTGTSHQTFKVLQEGRGLSVHFLIDLDGTIYQTLDVQERAWHATSANSRSVGVEIANIGGYGPGESNRLAEWYARDASNQVQITFPARIGDGRQLTKNFVGHPARPDPVKGVVQGRELIQYDFTPQQYAALIRLTAALCRTLPKINCDYPRDDAGQLISQKLPDDQLAAYQGVLGHYHIQTNKLDPGPALQWDYVIGEARKLIQEQPAPPSR
jgi:N-acetylmuramoyl-L-alanine amidase